MIEVFLCAQFFCLRFSESFFGEGVRLAVLHVCSAVFGVEFLFVGGAVVSEWFSLFFENVFFGRVC